VRNVERKYDNVATGRGREPVSVYAQKRRKGYGGKRKGEKERKKERKKECKHPARGVDRERERERERGAFPVSGERGLQGAPTRRVENYEAQVPAGTLLKNKKPHHFRRLS